MTAELDAKAALSTPLNPLQVSWSSADVLLYHLALGIGSQDGEHLDPRALALSAASDPEPLPTFAAMLPRWRATSLVPHVYPGLDLRGRTIVHASQSVTALAALPASGNAELTPAVVGVWDHGPHARIDFRTEVRCEAGIVAITEHSYLVLGAGGVGQPGSRRQQPEFDRRPDITTWREVLANQALLFRLCGDWNPLHADPESAARAGFPAPIVHGLWTYGALLWLVAKHAAFPGRSRWQMDFLAPVLPGTTIEADIWREADGLYVRARDTDREVTLVWAKLSSEKERD